MVEQKQVVVIGGGPGGYVAAIRAAQLGASVALIEKDALGGTCVNRGCIPTKALLEVGEVLSLAGEASKFGVVVEKVALDFPAAAKWKDQVVKRLVTGIGFLMRKHNIEVLAGRATVVDGHTVEVVETGEKRKSDCIIIASGSQPSRVPIAGIDGPGVMTSDEALSLTSLPSSVLIIGGGVIGLEFAQVWARMGVRVSVVEMMPHVVPGEDPELADMLAKALRNEGIEIICDAKVSSIETTSTGQKVSFSTPSVGSESRTTEKVLVAVGRSPYTEGLALEKLGIKQDNRGRIVVDERMKTNIPGIYAIGDVVGKCNLAHVAMEEGKCAAEAAMGLDSVVDYKAVPRCMYTHPELASVGASEAEAKLQYRAVKVGKFPLIANGRALTLNQEKGWVKVVCDAEYDELLGVQILGPHASELIGEAVLGMTLEATAETIGKCIHAHPTLSEAIMEAALNTGGNAIHV